MTAETRQALDRVSAGTPFDLYRFTRELALRIAMRALFGLDPDRARAGGINAAHEFEKALGFWARDYLHQILRGPGSPWRRMVAARRRLDALIFAEIDRRRASGERGDDILSLLLEATDEDGARLTKRHIRDEVMTLMFAGHDTTTSTVAFLFYELARNPDLVDDRVVQPRAGHRRDAAPVPAGVDRPAPLDRAVRLRRASRCPAACRSTTARGPATTCPTCGPSPTPSEPERFAPENRERIPKGAYVPFGGGSRMCIGMRFGQAEIGVIAAKILERFRLELAPGYELRDPPDADDRPRDGMPVTVVPSRAGHGDGTSREPLAASQRAARAPPDASSSPSRPSRSARPSRRPWSGSRPATGPRSGWLPLAHAPARRVGAVGRGLDRLVLPARRARAAVAHRHALVARRGRELAGDGDVRRPC